MNHGCSRLVIAGAASGVGKTSLALGLATALARRGLRVQTFKVGPDFLDPTHLALASARPCHNLDSWMAGGGYIRQLFASATADADLALIEGVMGLFDGASPTALEGSTAEIAALLAAPVLLVVNAHGAARSFAALVHGFAGFEPGVHIAGVIANHAGGARHAAWLREALTAARLPPLLGAIPRGALPALASRHLGLVAADPETVTPALLARLADACEQHLDIAAILALARQTPELSAVPVVASAPSATRVRLGVARDAAFHFYYPDNLTALEQAGAELVFFSPLNDPALPAGLDGLYLGGGYPEMYAAQLAANANMRQAIRDFAAADRLVYAECGGLMYLARQLHTLEGATLPMCGVLPVETEMLAQRHALGYVEVALAADGLWGRAGTTLRGHEFHYSKIVNNQTAAEDWQPAYCLRRRDDPSAQADGFTKAGVLASYAHLHWAAQPEMARQFVVACRRGFIHQASARDEGRGTRDGSDPSISSTINHPR